MLDQITLFGETNFRNQRQKFGIKTDDRRRHVYVIGKTGTGKTTLLENMVISDIRNGNGLALVDPHGEFADKMLDFVPKSRINDVIYFNPGDLEFPMALNVIEKVSPEQRHLVASGLIGVFKKIWADSWGPRLEYLLRNTILALLENPNSTLLGIMRMLSDKEYRKKVIENIEDPVVKSFWADEFQKYPDRFLAEAVAPIQNKVGQFLTSPLIRNIVGQVKSKINFREVMDEGKILIMNLSKGRMGEDNSALLGAMMITRLQLAAMSRIETPEEKRKDFYLYVDEFQNFATESFANILSEARKYRLNLTLAHQYVAQLEDPVRDAVFGNVGTLISFRVGAEDAEALEKELFPEFTANDLVNLAKYDIYLKLMIDGMASRPFSSTTLPPYSMPEKSYRDKAIKLTRERYATPREEVEKRISEWASASRAINSEALQRGRDMHEATCANCKGKALLPFKPDARRPVYCNDCLEKIRSGELPPIPKNKTFKPAPTTQPKPTQAQSVNKAELTPKPLTQAPSKPVEKVTPAKKEVESKPKTEASKTPASKPAPDRDGLKSALQDILKTKDQN